MKFGIMLPHSGALAGVEAIRRVALEADDLGFGLGVVPRPHYLRYRLVSASGVGAD